MPGNKKGTKNMTVTFVNVYHNRRWSYDNIEKICIEHYFIRIRDIDGNWFVIERGNARENPNACNHFIGEE